MSESSLLPHSSATQNAHPGAPPFGFNVRQVRCLNSSELVGSVSLILRVSRGLSTNQSYGQRRPHTPPPDEEYFLMTFFGLLIVGLYFLGRVPRERGRIPHV